MKIILQNQFYLKLISSTLSSKHTMLGKQKYFYYIYSKFLTKLITILTLTLQNDFMIKNTKILKLNISINDKFKVFWFKIFFDACYCKKLLLLIILCRLAMLILFCFEKLFL